MFGGSPEERSGSAYRGVEGAVLEGLLSHSGVLVAVVRIVGS